MSLDQFLASLPPGELWVFGYGSLMWSPGFRYRRKSAGFVFGYHRSLCVFSHRYRGTPQRPGLVMGLCRGGSCWGMAYGVQAAGAREVLEYLWHREMRNHVYMPRLVTVRVGARPVRALAFIADAAHPQFAGDLKLAEAAEIVALADGTLRFADHTPDQPVRLALDNVSLNVTALGNAPEARASLKFAGEVKDGGKLGYQGALDLTPPHTEGTLEVAGLRLRTFAPYVEQLLNVAITGGTGTAGATLSGTKTVAAVAGVATFSTLNIDRSGTGYTLTFTASGVTDIVSAAFTINPGAAAVLVFTVQPTTGTAGVTIAPPVQVTARDALGNTVTGFTGNVTVAITPATGAVGAVLSGTKTVAAVAGVASFSTLSIDLAAVGYRLDATSGVLPLVTSNAFTMQ